MPRVCPLNYLSFGDPHGLTGIVHRWNDLNQDHTLQANEVGMTLAAVGPCCANGRLNTHRRRLAATAHDGNPRVAADPTDGSSGAAPWRHRPPAVPGLIQPVNAADVPGNFSLTHVEDPGLNMLGPEDDQLLPIFNRLPAELRDGLLRAAERRQQLGARPRPRPRAGARLRRPVGHAHRRDGTQVRQARAATAGSGRTRTTRACSGRSSASRTPRRSRPDGSSSSAAMSSSGRRCTSCRTGCAAAPRPAIRTASTSHAS